MTSYLGELFSLVFAAYCGIGLGILALILIKVKEPKTKAIAAIAVVALFAIYPAKAFLAARSKEQMLIARNTAMNAQFEKRCKEDARVTIKRVIENVDGVFIMKPRKVATSELQDQFWMGDPYGYTVSGH